MKVGFVNNAWRGTGVGRYAFDLFTQYKQMKKDFNMLYINSKFSFGLDDELIKIIKSSIKNATFSNFFIYPGKILSSYDVYHVSNETIAKCCKGRKSVLTIAALLPFISNKDSFLKKLMEKMQLANAKNAERIITFANATKDHISKELKIDQEKIKVVYPGVNHDLFKPRDKTESRKKYNLPLDKKIILHVGTEEPRKNVETFLKALPELVKSFPDILFVRVGWQSQSCKEIIEKNNLQNFVKYMDIPTQVVHEIYNAADLFVFPSYYEGFNFTLAEALSSGLPTVTANISANPEVVGDASILVDPYDPKGFSDGTSKILTDHVLAKKLSKDALQQADKFQWSKSAEETWKTYEELI